MKIILVAGARPNFMKIAPLIKQLNKLNNLNPLNLLNPLNKLTPVLIHTGQHYDYEMSKVFFEDLEIPEPDIYLNVGSGTHAEQTGKVMIEFEKVLFQEKPDLVVVVGDVNSTLACALATIKFRCATNSFHPLIAHVEAGLRSFDRNMPEEINRILTDQISDFLFTPSPDADENLKKEGISEKKIFLVGDIMVDSLLANKEKAKKSKILEKLALTPPTPYALLTLHRPSNVDNKESLTKIAKALNEIASRIPILFPAHPRTQKMIKKFGLESLFEKVKIIKPIGYLDFLNLQMNARFVLTDSGGIQEETTVLGIPCLTLRNTTERPITLAQGTNVLVGNDTEKIIKEAKRVLKSSNLQSSNLHNQCIKFWDGKTAERILEIILKIKN